MYETFAWWQMGVLFGVREPMQLVTDAYFAAPAMESGAEWITEDRDYARFPGLHWRHPLA
jgi:hypothetical protein